ncbi:MAG TPA: DNA-3-methyladenine glycosylase [Ignavibacteria bacterium]|nr:DNA-3-methyladenine glycosylase [Ignavibacteria bacterium]HRB00032.1 DNA-3-methyladenine glycosylase [Ignavibacteria bacterium]
MNLYDVKSLSKEFYLKDAVIVAKDLLGKLIIRKFGNKFAAVKIVETEAYFGDHDPACHAFGRVTKRNSVIYGPEGKAYVYFIYGSYYCFNAVCGKEGTGNAILIRAGEPVEGIEIMKKFRPNVKNDIELTNGPSKLCMAMNVDLSLNRTDITNTDSEIFIAENDRIKRSEIITSRRIGLNKGVEFPYRFFIKENPFVTKHKFNLEQ